MSLFKTQDGLHIEVTRTDEDGERAVKFCLSMEGDPLIELTVPPSAAMQIGDMLIAASKVD